MSGKARSAHPARTHRDAAALAQRDAAALARAQRGERQERTQCSVPLWLVGKVGTSEAQPAAATTAAGGAHGASKLSSATAAAAGNGGSARNGSVSGSLSSKTSSSSSVASRSLGTKLESSASLSLEPVDAVEGDLASLALGNAGGEDASSASQQQQAAPVRFGFDRRARIEASIHASPQTAASHQLQQKRLLNPSSGMSALSTSTSAKQAARLEQTRTLMGQSKNKVVKLTTVIGAPSSS